SFDYNEAYPSGSPEAYETLLLDIMKGDSTLFMRADQVEAAWNILMPILESWEKNPPVDFPNYAAGTQGPEDAEALIARDGHNWLSNSQAAQPLKPTEPLRPAEQVPPADEQKPTEPQKPTDEKEM